MTDARPALSLWLDRLALRSMLEDDDRKGVLTLPGHFELVAPNRDFVHLGEKAMYASLIVSGLAGRFGQVRSGSRQMTALHLPGDMADLHSVVLPQAGTALQSIGETLVYRVPHEAIRALARRSPMLAEAFWRDCTVDGAVLSHWNLITTRLSAQGRDAHILCEICCRFAHGLCRDDASFEWPLTQTHLADMTGLSPVHVNRMLRAIREEGAAEIVARRMRVLDWNRLVAMADFDPRYLVLQEAD